MSITNHERVGKAMDLLKEGLAPFIEREFVSVYKKLALDEAKRFAADDRLNTNRPLKEWDAAPLLRLMWDAWNDVFRKTLGQGERSLISELREVRKKWAHQEPFSGDDADRVLDLTERLLTAVSAPQAEGVRKLKMELRRLIGKTPHTTVIGVEPKSLEMSLELSPEIKDKVPRVIELVLEDLKK